MTTPTCGTCDDWGHLPCPAECDLRLGGKPDRDCLDCSGTGRVPCPDRCLTSENT